MHIIAEKLAVRRGEERIFADVSFTLDNAQSLVITGPNGVGKSTLLRALAGLLPFEAGAVQLFEGDEAIDQALCEFCHYIGHQNAMKSELTVYENLTFWHKVMHMGDGSFLSAEEAADAFGLSHTLDLPFGILSQGQRRRMALTKLLVAHRPIWLLDEPTAALDKKSTDLFADLTNQYIQNGGIVIAATHVPLGFDDAKSLEMARLDRDLDEGYF